MNKRELNNRRESGSWGCISKSEAAFYRKVAIRRCLLAVAAVSLCLASGSDQPTAATIDAYLQPYVQTANFAGAVLVKRNENIVFKKAYGFAQREQKVRNSASTQFHIASMSMQFTAAAVLKLVDQGAIRLDSSAEKFALSIPGADKITIRDLLNERSGLPDINSLPEYDEILQHRQTPATLVAKISGRPLLFEPGSKFLHEEHSAYNLLALIVEQETKLPFAAAVQRLVFAPLALKDSFIDDDTTPRTNRQARGYEPVEVYGLKPATAIHWSAKAGNASVCTTTMDEAQWVNALFAGNALSASSQKVVLDTTYREGYGWFKGANQRLGETVYYMNGRSPGFASFVLYLPKEALTVVVFSNIYSSVTSNLGYDIASIVLGLPYEKFHPEEPAPAASQLQTCTGSFQFGQDFYQVNAKLDVIRTGSELSIRWPSGSLSPLIPISTDYFLDRMYWVPVVIERNASGKPESLRYDRFCGKATQ